MKRGVRVLATLALTGLAVAYLVWKVDIGETAEVLADASPWWFLLAVAIMTLTVVPMAERWRRLLRSQGMHERLPWLTRAYFVSYTAGQILPTSIGGDAVRILETSRRHPARLGAISAIVLLERALGGAATVLLGAVGFLLAIGRYDVGAYLWIEGAFVLLTFLLAFLMFSRSARPILRATAPLLRRLRLERPVRAVYDGIHVFRDRTGLLVGLFVFTVAIQAVRVLAIWATARGGGDRPLAADLLRDGPALLPRPARAVHAERVRGPRGVLRQLPRRCRGGRRPGVRGRFPLLPRHRRDGDSRRRDPALGGAPREADCRPMPDASVVVVTYNALPWIEQSIESVRDEEVVVVDNGSTDGTVDVVRELFPQARLIERENLGLASGWNAGMAAVTGRYFLLLNADAWLTDGSLARLVEFADAHPEAAVVGPKLLNTDGTLQRSVRGFPTLWRLATEYFFLRKLAPGSQLFNAFYAGGFAHDEEREVEVVMGACMLVRREAVEQVGPLDESFFLFSEETDWCYRFGEAGWKVLFFPGAECVHVGGASHGGRMFRENVRGHLRFLAKHRGVRYAERARRLLGVSLRLRARLFRDERGRMYRDAADWLASGRMPELLER